MDEAVPRSGALSLESPFIVKGSARFSRDRTIRSEIRRWWVGSPTRWAAWLMLNPSDAGAERNDPTALRVTHFTRSHGYDGWIGANLYPWISPTPSLVWARSRYEEHGPDWEARDDMMANLETIERVGREAAIRIVAFGREAVERDQIWLEQCLEAFQQPSDVGTDQRLFCLGTSKNGQPIHPLARGKHRVPDDARFQLWRD